MTPPKARADAAPGDAAAPGVGPAPQDASGDAAASGDADDEAARSARAALLREVAQLGYEDARDALVDIVRRLEAGGATLEESLTLWERGEALAERCEQWLAGARARLDAAQRADGGHASGSEEGTAAGGRA